MTTDKEFIKLVADAFAKNRGHNQADVIDMSDANCAVRAIAKHIKPLIDAMEDAELWVAQMREGVDKWSNGGCGLDARCENMEAWVRRDVKPALYSIPPMLKARGE